MKLKSTYKLTDRYFINETIDDMCTLTIVDLGSEKEEKSSGMGENESNETAAYVYDAVELKVMNNQKYIKSHLDYLWNKAKVKEESK